MCKFRLKCEAHAAEAADLAFAFVGFCEHRQRTPNSCFTRLSALSVENSNSHLYVQKYSTV